MDNTTILNNLIKATEINNNILKVGLMIKPNCDPIKQLIKMGVCDIAIANYLLKKDIKNAKKYFALSIDLMVDVMEISSKFSEGLYLEECNIFKNKHNYFKNVIEHLDINYNPAIMKILELL